jgi:2-desacetyl-2-hydroxyethyl bacteriochlorophyllide A dehydrogenase
MMNEPMHALLYRTDFTLEVVDLAAPTPGPHEVVVEVSAAGICGSDVHGVASRSSRRQPPLVMGHELAGRVVEVGAEVAGDLAGKRVAVNPQVPCGLCLACRSGGENVCADRELVGGTRPGGFAELVCVPASCIHPVSDALDPSVAVLAEPLATCVHALQLLGAALPATVVVVGGGPIGFLAAALARHVGAHAIVVSEPDAERRTWVSSVADSVVHPDDLMEAVAERTAGQGADLAIDAVGLNAARGDSVRVLSRRGTALWLGMHDADAVVPAFDLVVREQRVQGAFAYTNADFSRAVRLLEREPGAFAMPCVSSPLSEGSEVFGRLLDGETAGVLKATLVP